MDAPGAHGPASLPPFEPLVAAADEARARGDLDGALEAYKKALMLVPEADAAARAALLLRVGDAKRAQGKLREAESAYEKALAACPADRGALAALVALATDAKDARREATFRRKLALALPEGEDRVRELVALARVLDEGLGDRREAAAVLAEARASAPRDRGVLAALRALFERTHAWASLVEVLAAEAELEGDAVARAALRFAAADVCLGRLRKEREGLALAEAALADDPAHDRALGAVEAVRGRRGEWAELAALYERLVGSDARRGDAERAHALCVKLGTVRRDRLRDGPGALEAFEGAVRVRPSDVDARAQLADLLYAGGRDEEAIAALEEISRIAPTRPGTYARLSVIHHRAGRLDAAWLAAMALEELGAADVDQQLLLDQFRPDGAIRPGDVLDDAAWDAHLRAPGADEVVAAVLRAVGPAAVAARLDELRAQRRLAALDPARKQPPTSTATAVRTFAWASRVLGVPLPELYVLDDVPGGVAAAPAKVPSVAVGPEVARGLSVQELAFVVARHLTYYRPEHYVLVFFPSLDELSALFLAALAIPLEERASRPSLNAASARLHDALRRHLDGKAHEALTGALERLDARGGRADLAAWVRSVEHTANRAGLLLAGDLSVAMRRVRGETRAVGGVGESERRADLLAFCASGRHAALRARLRIGAGTPSMMPPPGSVAPPAAAG